MKQLTTNPSPKSVRLGWQLMALCLQCFPPDPMVENFVERFIRERTAEAHARELIGLMHRTVRTGPLRKVPPQAQIAAMLAACDGSYPRLSLTDEVRNASMAIPRRATHGEL